MQLFILFFHRTLHIITKVVPFLLIESSYPRQLTHSGAQVKGSLSLGVKSQKRRKRVRIRHCFEQCLKNRRLINALMCNQISSPCVSYKYSMY
jgi:hypothetical protein